MSITAPFRRRAHLSEVVTTTRSVEQNQSGLSFFLFRIWPTPLVVAVVTSSAERALLSSAAARRIPFPTPPLRPYRVVAITALLVILVSRLAVAPKPTIPEPLFGVIRLMLTLPPVAQTN